MRHYEEAHPTAVSGDRFEKVATLVDALAPFLGGRVICLVCVDEQGAMFVAPKPGSEKATLRHMAAIDWRAAQMRFEEWFA